MKRLSISLLVIMILLSACSQSTTRSSQGKEEQSIRIKGQITYESTYCGGAAPGSDFLIEKDKSKPLANYKLHLKAGDQNKSQSEVVASFVTDAQGGFDVTVPAGTYVLVTEHHLDKTIMQNPGKNIRISNLTKLEAWWREGLAVVSSDQHIDLQWKQRCHLPLGVPGLLYTGPIAP